MMADEMHRVVYTESGKSNVLRFVPAQIPDPGPGEVRIRVVRAGVDPTDWKFRCGFVAMSYPEVCPGQDGAGVVDALGAGVEDLAVGDRVWLVLAQYERPYGTAAEFTIQPSERVMRLPDDASFDLGASLGVPAVTAHRALTSAQGSPDSLRPGSLIGMTVLVAGGAGAVGNAAIQLAKWAGAKVVTTVSSLEKARLATAAGADQVVNYRVSDARDEILRAYPGGVDLVVEVAPEPNNSLNLAVLKNLGTVAVYASDGGNELRVKLFQTYSKNLRYQFILLYFLTPEMIACAAAAINEAIGDGGFGVCVEHGLPVHYFPLSAAGEAHNAVEAGIVGKVLLDTGHGGV